MNRKHGSPPPPADLAAQLAETQARLAEAEETLEAIRTGAVDALVVSGPTGERVFSLEGAETPYRSLVEAINEGALLLRPDGTILYANARFAELANQPLQQVIGSPCHRFFPPADHSRLERLLAAARRDGHWEEFSLQAQVGAARPVGLYVSLLRGGPQAETFTAIVTDLTERKAAEQALRQANEQLEARVRQRTVELSQTNEALRESEQRFRMLADAMPQLAWMAQADGYIFWFNRRWHEYTGTTPQQMEGWGWQSVHAPETLPKVMEGWKAAIATGQAFEMEFPLRGADGRFRQFLTRAFPLKDAHGRVVQWFGTNTDVEELKRAALEMAALQEQLSAELAAMNQLHELSTRFVRQEDSRTLLEAILDAGIAILGAQKGYIQVLHPASDELSIRAQRGFDPAYVEFFSHIDPGTVVSGTPTKAGQSVIVEDVALSPRLLANPRALELKLAAGVRAVVCTPLLTRAGQLLGVFSAHFDVPHRPSERDLHLLELLARQAADLIERIQDERALLAARRELALANTDLEAKVRARTAKLQETVAELEHFSYTITHDMRAPLRAMTGLGDILREQCSDCTHTVRLEYLRRIAESAERMDQLITGALQYSGVLRQHVPLAPVDTGALLRGILESYPQFQPPRANVRIDGPLPRVLGNQSALTQCFSNLLENAVKFVHPGQTPEVRIWAEVGGGERQSVGASERDASAPQDAPRSTLPTLDARTVRLWFEDEGIGIEAQYHEKIWQMFQQLNKDFEGTGVGLALVRKAVDRMEGKVGVESEFGEGCRFWIELKEAGAEPQPDALSQAA
jgi:PAS domain S-box-containing protein